MDIFWAIRSGILLVAALFLILVPDKVYQFQLYLVEGLHIRYNVERDRKYYPIFGSILIIAAIILFMYSTNIK